ncbi:MAG: hypothetical protein AAFN78_02060 [Pseudomonadota bacterium]
MKIKGYATTAFATAGLLLGSSAGAAISAGNFNLGQPAGELFLAVWDPVNQISYTRDLGVDVLATDFSTANLNFSADALFAQTFAGSDAANLRYSVVGVNNDLTDELVLGVWTTSNSSNVDIPVNEFAALNSISQNILGYTIAVNEGAGTLDFAENVSSVITDSDSSGYYGNPATFNETLGSIASFNTGAGIGDSLAFYSLVISNDTGGTLGVNQFASSWTLALNGDLSYSTAVIPVPPALLLFGSALLGFVGFGRRNSA